jgi:hypothetical protein
MTTVITDTDPPFPGPPLGDREFRRFVTGLGIVYLVAILALFTKLLIFPASRAGPALVIPGATSIANDVTAIHTDFSVAGDVSAGSGYLDFVPPPGRPRSTLGFSPASTMKQTHESGNPETAQQCHIVARTHAFSFIGD